MLFGTEVCARGEVANGTFFGSSGEVCDFGVAGSAFSAAIALALPLMEKDILLLGASASVLASVAVLGFVLDGVGLVAEASA